MKRILCLIVALLSGCETTVGDAGKHLDPNYFELSYRAGTSEAISTVNPEAAKIIESLKLLSDNLVLLVAESSETQHEIDELQEETLFDDLGKKEAWGGGILTSLIGLFLMLKRFGIINGKHSTKDEE